MKKVIGAVLLVSLLLGIRLSVWQTTLCSMDHRFPHSETGTAEVSFSLETGDHVRLFLSSAVDSGSYHAAVYDADGGLVEDIGMAKRLKLPFAPGAAGTYTLRVEYDCFAGSFRASVRR